MGPNKNCCAGQWRAALSRFLQLPVTLSAQPAFKGLFVCKVRAGWRWSQTWKPSQGKSSGYKTHKVKNTGSTGKSTGNNFCWLKFSAFFQVPAPCSLSDRTKQLHESSNGPWLSSLKLSGRERLGTLPQLWLYFWAFWGWGNAVGLQSPAGPVSPRSLPGCPGQWLPQGISPFLLALDISRPEIGPGSLVWST